MGSGTKRAREHRGIALLLAALLILPAGTLALGPWTGGSSRGIGHARGGATDPLPAAAVALSAAWGARAGFDPGFAAEVGATGPATGNVTVHLTLSPRSMTLFQPPSRGSTPLSDSQVADRFGLPASNYSALGRYFEANGLSIVYQDPDRLALTLRGPASDVSAAFGTTLESGSWNGSPVRYPSAVPRLPVALESEVSAVSGLSDGFDRFTLPLEGVHALAPSRSPGPARTTTAITPSALHAAYDLDALYNYSGSTHFPTGRSIAVLLWGQGFDPADLKSFFQQEYPSEFPSVNISWYPVDGASSPGPNAVNDPSHAPQELTLDLEYAGSAAPGATLDAVYAPDGPASRGYSPSDADMETALNTAVGLANVDAISMSFGTPDHSDPSFQAAFETAFAVAGQRQITLLAASGDNGGTPVSGVCPSGGPAPQYPAASPQVLAVGGVSPTLSLSVLGSVDGLASETAWNGSGGGFSASYGVPSWQLNSSAKATFVAGGHRGISDVAGPATFNRFFYNGVPMAGNGTSFATPFWAGMITDMDALLPRPLGFVDPALYAIASAEGNGSKAPGLVHVSGESGPSCLTAGAGWNPPTGWGSPRAGLLFEDLIASLVNISFRVDPADVAPGGSLTAVVQVLNASSHAPIADLPVAVTLSSDGAYFGPCGGTVGSLVLTTDLGGNGTATLSVPACFLGSTLLASATVSANGYFGSQTVSLHVNLLGLGGLYAIAQYYPYNIGFFVAVMAAATAVGIFLGRWRRRRRNGRSGPARSAPPAMPPSAPATVPDPAAPDAPAPPGPPDAATAPAAAEPPAGPPGEAEASSDDRADDARPSGELFARAP